MADYVVWMDSRDAQIFSLAASGIEKSKLEKSELDHHTHNKKDHDHDSNSEHYYHDLAIRLKDADKLLIMGPGLAKNKFKTHLEAHHHQTLAKKIVGIENADHPTDNQIFAIARKFFKTYNLFNDPM